MGWEYSMHKSKKERIQDFGPKKKLLGKQPNWKAISIKQIFRNYD